MDHGTDQRGGWPQEVQDAYSALLDHLSTCPDCPDATGCAVAQGLRAAYKALRHGPERVCASCDQVIADPADAVAVAHDLGNSGPGWTKYAHRAHADDVELIDPDLLRIMMRLWAAGS